MPHYYPDDQERWLADKRADATLVLDDNSLWQVDTREYPKIANWVRFSCISVVWSTETPSHPYRLINRSFNQQVRAKFLGVVTDAAPRREGAA